MGMCCAISDCPNHNSPRLDASYFRIPDAAKYPILNRRWMRALKMPEKRSTRHMRVCELHFEDDDFNQTYKLKKMLMPASYFKPMLNPEAVPKLRLKQRHNEGYQNRKILWELLGDSYWKWKRTVKPKRKKNQKKEAEVSAEVGETNISSVLFVTVKEEPPEVSWFTCCQPIPRTHFYCCKFCTFTTRLQRHLVAHTKSHRNPMKPTKFKEPLTYRCTNCDFSTFSKLLLIRHAFQEDEMHLLLPKPRPIPVKNPSGETFQCKSCCYSNNRQHSLKLHLLRYHGYKEEMLMGCEVCKYKTFYADLLEKHIRGHSQKVVRFWCDQCGYKTRFKQLLMRHKLKHGGEGLLCCACEFRTDCEEEFKRHVVWKHGVVKLENEN